MENIKTPITETQTPEITPRIIEYAELVKLIRLSVARELNLAGSFATDSLDELLAPLEIPEQTRINNEVGARFDEALLHFLGATAIAHRHQEIVILAGADEGINGYLPWEDSLKQRQVSDNRLDGLYLSAIRVERIPTPEQIASDIGSIVCEQTVDIA